MTDNILKNQILCTCGEYLAEVYGARTKPFRDAVLHVFDAIVTGSTTLVSDLSRTLRRDASPAEAKRTQELVSRWLERYDFTSPLNPHLLGGAAGATDATTFAVDFSDVSKEFGGAGMEGMAMGWDGSRGVAAMGHDFVCVSRVGAECPEAQPVYARIAQGRKAKRELLRDALDAVAGATGGLGWFAEDRGMDAAEHLRDLKALGRKAVVRVKDMRRDVFGNGRAVDETLAGEAVHSVLLHVHSGDRRAELRFRPGVVRFCAEERRRDAPVEDVRVLVVESRFDGKSIYVYAVCPDEMLATPEGRLAVATRAAQAYCDRWQIETSFRVVKQEFALEKVRVRTFRRLENVFTLCVLAYKFATDRLRKSRGFKKVLKLLSDNVERVSMRTHALLAGIRALVREPKIRFISGRPRKDRVVDNPLQMTFLL